MNKVASFLILLKYINIKRAQRAHGARRVEAVTIFDCWIIIAYFAAYLGGYIRSYFGWRCLIGFLLSAAEGFAWWTCTLMSHTQKKIAVESKADNGSSSSICLWNIALAMLTSDEISRTSVTATKRRCCLYECVCVCVTLCVCVYVCSQWTQD